MDFVTFLRKSNEINKKHGMVFLISIQTFFEENFVEKILF